MRSGQTLKDWIDGLEMYPQVMVNVPIVKGSDWQNHAGMQAAKAQVEQRLGDKGRVLIRASGTEPKLRLMVEAETYALAKECVDILADVDLRK